MTDSPEPICIKFTNLYLHSLLNQLEILMRIEGCEKNASTLHEMILHQVDGSYNFDKIVGRKLIIYEVLEPKNVSKPLETVKIPWYKKIWNL